MIQTGNQRHLVPKSTRQVQNRDPPVPSRQIFENGERIVAATIEHINDAKGETLREPGQDNREGPVKNSQPFLLIVNRENNVDGHCSAFGVRRSAFGVRRSAFGVRRLAAFGGRPHADAPNRQNHAPRPFTHSPSLESKLMFRAGRREKSHGVPSQIRFGRGIYLR